MIFVFDIINLCFILKKRKNSTIFMSINVFIIFFNTEKNILSFVIQGTHIFLFTEFLTINFTLQTIGI